LKGDTGQCRTQPVVQVVPQPPALFPGGDDLHLGAAQLVGQCGCLHGGRERCGQHLQSGPVPAAEPSLPSSHPDDQLTDPLAPVQQRNVLAGPWLAVAGDLRSPTH
jgi:hypothetical protein